ncbi:MAG: tetratricopeptide repeat protein, partial [Candidatus Acidiferrales bacterium]
MKCLVSTLLLILLAGACSAPAPAAQARISPEEINRSIELYNRGRKLYEIGKVNEAIVLYRQALAINPAYPEALSNLGLALDSEGKDDEAVRDLDLALEYKPSDAITESNLGLA